MPNVYQSISIYILTHPPKNFKQVHIMNLEFFGHVSKTPKVYAYVKTTLDSCTKWHWRNQKWNHCMTN